MSGKAKVSMPQDGNFKPMPITPAMPAKARTVDATIDAATTVTFATGTTMIRVYAFTQDVYLKWGVVATLDATNFDEVIPAGQICDFAIPLQTNGSLYATAQVIARVAGAGVIIIEK